MPGWFRRADPGGAAALIAAEAIEAIGVGRYPRCPDRGPHRNGHRPKTVSTTAGNTALQIPKLRARSFFPPLLLEVVAELLAVDVDLDHFDIEVGVLGLAANHGRWPSEPLNR